MIPLEPFDYDPRTRVVFGAGSLSRLGELVAETGGQRVMVVTDRGLAEAGHLERSVSYLEAAGFDVVVFDDVTSNPTTDDVDRAMKVAQSGNIDCLVGLGGGSSMDCAKGVNFLLTNGGRMEDYWGVGKAKLPMLPMIAVPTTSGTGSEAQSFAVIAQVSTHRKMACGDKKAACRVAILDPDLTVTMPRSVTAVTGIDAISHALETYVTSKRNPVSQLFSLRAWRLLSWGFPRVLDDPGHLPARAAMLLGAHLAGAAIENSMLGATHALANPLTAQFGITHGVAIGIMLPHVIRYNAVEVSALYGDLAVEAGLCDRDDPEASLRLADYVAKLVQQADAPTSLTEFHVPVEATAELAEDAAQQWTGRFNPRPIDRESLQELYACAIRHSAD